MEEPPTKTEESQLPASPLPPTLLSSATDNVTPVRGVVGDGGLPLRRRRREGRVCGGRTRRELFPQAAQSAVSRRTHHCPYCHKSFTSKFKLMRHSLIHSDSKTYTCNVCSKKFKRKDHLKNHLKVHDLEKPKYKCGWGGECEKEYGSMLSLRKHRAVHSAEEGDPQCQLCGLTLQTTQDTLAHLRTHSKAKQTHKAHDDKKYTCEVCERRFVTRKDVRRHSVVHTKERCFECPLCPQKFGRKDHLLRHTSKSHTPPGVGRQRSRPPLKPVSTVMREALPSTSMAPSPPLSSPLLPPSSPLLPHDDLLFPMEPIEVGILESLLTLPTQGPLPNFMQTFASPSSPCFDPPQGPL